ncbi:MAG TPA: DUF3105 domain-containing protein [Micromonosporaceae bacterium]|nr:DUF3105 domain-containing protein [Micromonosporaceae bacterium]
MSISTQGGEQRRPSTVSTGKKAPGGKATAAKTGGGKAGATKGGGGKGPRRPVKPVKVQPGRSWGPIAVIAAVLLLAVGIIGYGGWAVYQGARSFEDRAGDIDGLINIRESNPKSLEYESHKSGPLTYPWSPPVGGAHNESWQNCTGDVYDAPIASEHAVHSLEHGAVWVTYRPDLAKDQVEQLAAKVRGKDKMLMSPYEGLDKPISLQAWGYQLKVDNVDDERIDEFIKTMRVNASIEGPNANCSQGITATGTTPRDVAPPTQQ